MFSEVIGSLNNGFLKTLELFCCTLLGALPLGLLVAFGSMSRFSPLRMLVKAIVWIMRGTPLMLQLLFVYFALPMVGIMLPDIAAALLAFVLNYALHVNVIYIILSAALLGIGKALYLRRKEAA